MQVPGTVYKVLRLLAQGGMGFVYDVEDVSVGKRYVLKTLTPELLGRRDLARRMEAEARVLARLSHPNVVDVITAGTTQDDQRMPYFVMERLNGQSLRTVLDKKGALDLSLACRIGIDVLDALEHAHDNGVIHRDVKPDNIFLHRTAVGTTVTKLLDFGVMRLVDSNLDDTRGRFVGTLRYAAPEQILGKEAGPAADLYATALVLYELSAGRGPFDELDEMVQLANAHVNEAPPPLSQFVALPPVYEQLVMSALSKDPERRPRDAFSFAAELRKLLKSAQRAVEATSARTAIAPLSSAGTPAMASGSQPQAPSSGGSSEDALSALAAASSQPNQDGLQAYAKTLAGGEPLDPSTLREGPAAPNFAETLRIPESPTPLGGRGVDRHALTKSSIAEPLPRPSFHDTLAIEPRPLVTDPNALVFAPERPAPTTTSALVDEAPAGLGAPRRTGIAAVALLSLLGVIGVGVVGWRVVGPRMSASAAREPSAELPALTASITPPAAAAPSPSGAEPAADPIAPVTTEAATSSAPPVASAEPTAAAHKPSVAKTTGEAKPKKTGAKDKPAATETAKPSATKPSNPSLPKVDF